MHAQNLFPTGFIRAAHQQYTFGDTGAQPAFAKQQKPHQKEYQSRKPADQCCQGATSDNAFIVHVIGCQLFRKIFKPPLFQVALKFIITKLNLTRGMAQEALKEHNPPYRNKQIHEV
ncbi:MAG TPA: hypothetical protein DCS92_21990 [Gammaproteobacteria bacterium]|nr:hypothetical protein [Pseudomonadales bacterium]MAR93397.1 hypothetical protein [Pseudomonadales bacterium]HAU16407.1 hypothetical protein [Gammaproteobacteria bacterium]